MAKRNIIPPDLDLTDARQVYGVVQTRDFYKGTSFQMNEGWHDATHYYNDEFIVSFVSYDGALVFCKENHTSNAINKPIVIKDEEGLVIGIEPNEYWSFVSGGTPGPVGDDGKTWVPQIKDGILTWTLEDVPPTQSVNIKGEPGEDAYDQAKEYGYPYSKEQFAKDLSEISDKVRRSGDEMEGRLLLNESPTDASPALQAATKEYVDEKAINTFHTFDEKYFDDQGLYVTLQNASIDDAVVANISQNKVTGLIDALNSKNGIIAAGPGIEIVRDSSGRTTISSAQDIFEVVSVRPIIGEPNKVYLVPKNDGSGQFEQWIYENGVWEDLGTSGASVDLSNYYNKQNVDSLLSQKANVSTVEQHINDVQNPHEVTAAQVGLGNVNNTSDLDKPISNAVQTALGTKADVSQVVRIFGNQTIDGEKTFNTVPVTSLPPIRPQDIVNKLYVDGALIGKANQVDLTNEVFSRQIADSNLDAKINTKMSRLVAGDNIQIDYSNPDAPKISATGGGGTNDHTILLNRSAADQHPISAITGLQNAIDGKAFDANVVHRNGNLAESIDGVKSFVRIPMGPNENPTLADQLTRKGYVDGRIDTVNSKITALDEAKQNKLIAGDNITIDNTIPTAPIISAAGNVMDAPIDGILYGRMDGTWVDIESSKGFVPYTDNGSVPVKSGGSLIGTLLDGTTKRLVTLREVLAGSFTNLRIGDDLSGRTLAFNNGGFNVISPAGAIIDVDLQFSNGAILTVHSQELTDPSGAFIRFTHLGAQDEVVYDFTHTPKWTRDSITFPADSVFIGYVSRGFPTEVNSLTELDTYLNDWRFGLATLSVGNTSQVILGDGSVPAEIIGNQDRAFYNGEEIALMSDLGAAFPEAPIDGKTYGRKDASWVEVENALSVIEVDLTPEIDGVKTDFVLPEGVIGNSVVPFYNGQRLFRGYNYTYDESSRTISLTFVPEVGDQLIVSVGEIEATTEVNVSDVMVNGTSVVTNKIANVIIPEVDLSNYYTKGETYNRTEIDAAIAVGSYEFDTNYFTNDNNSIGLVDSSIGDSKISSISQSKVDGLVTKLTSIDGQINSMAAHTTNYNNPHQVTKAQLSLSNVDNTSDINKPVSTATRTAIDDAAATLQTSINAIDTRITSGLAQEIIDRQTADTVFSGGIATLEQGLADEIERATAASQANTDRINTINTKINQNVVTDVSYSVSSTGITRTTTKRNLNTETNSTTHEAMPVVSTTQAGIVLPDLFNTVNTNNERITNLENNTSVELTNQPTKAALDSYTIPETAKAGDIAVVQADETQGGASTRYRLAGDPLAWVFDLKYGAPTPQATQTTLGTVKGNIASGTVAIETDGSMSVNGWDALQNSIPNAVGQLTNDVGYITAGEVVIADATSTIKGIATLGAVGGAARYGQKSDVALSNVDNTSDINKPISSATQTALNDKLDKFPQAYRVYTTSENGEQGVIPWSLDATGGNFVRRGDNGNVTVPSNVTGDNAVGASQVQSMIDNNYEEDPVFTNWRDYSRITAAYGASAGNFGVAIGQNSASGNYGVAIGYNARENNNGVAIGQYAVTNAIGAIQFGEGTNGSTNTLQFRSYPLIYSNGKIPIDRLTDATSTSKGVALLGASGGAARYGQKGDVGLSNVDNTSDLNKPISTATQSALDTKLGPIQMSNALLATDSSNAVRLYPHSNSVGEADSFVRRNSTSNIPVLQNVTGDNAIGATQVDSKIATAVSTKANDNAVVKLTGNQTIAGVKTFDSSPVVPTVPTNDTSAVNKFYVDNAISEIPAYVETDPIFTAWKNNISIAAGSGASAPLGGVAIGMDSSCGAGGAIALGKDSGVMGVNSVALGQNAVVPVSNSVQLGTGTNLISNTLQFGPYQLVNGSGKIPQDRLLVWYGTQMEYDAITIKDPQVEYNIYED